MAVTVIAYTYDADTHCPPCAARRFSAHTLDHTAPECAYPEAGTPTPSPQCETDQSHNVPGAVLSLAEAPAYCEHCTDCGAAIRDCTHPRRARSRRP